MRSARFWLFLCCATSVCLYGAIAWTFWTNSGLGWTAATALLLNGAAILLTAIYFLALPLVRHARQRDIVISGLLLAGAGFAMGPFDSTDAFFYMAQGWGQVRYNTNPYASTLRQIPDRANDPMIAHPWMSLNTNPWLDEPMPYGFGFALLTRGVAWLGAGNLVATLLLFDLLNLALHVGIGVLLWKASRLIPGADPKLILYLYAWSPLVLLQFLANLHNDIVMVSLVLFALYCGLGGRAVWATPLLVAAGMIKYLAFALLPFALVLTFRKSGWRGMLTATLFGAVTGILLSLPYVSEFQNFRFSAIVTQFSGSSGSLHAFVIYTYRAAARLVTANPSLDTIGKISSLLLWSAVVAFFVMELKKAWQQTESDPLHVVSSWTAVLSAIVFVGSSQFYPWYVGMVFPIALLGLGVSRLTTVILLLSGTHTALAFMRGKAIGYFLLATALPILLLFALRRQRETERGSYW